MIRLSRCQLALGATERTTEFSAGAEHTCASLLFASGRNAVQAQRWLDHHSAAFTFSRYVHLLDGDLGEALSLPAQGVNRCEHAPHQPTPLRVASTTPAQTISNTSPDEASPRRSSG